MPAEVESTERRRQIGEAALRVVRERGAAQLTIRAVAQAMGGSTSLITHYVRNRRELLILAFTTVEHRWAAEEQRLADLPAAERIEQLAAWGADWSREEDEVVAALLLHFLTEAKPAPEDLAVVHHTLDAWHRELGQAAEAAGIPDPWASRRPDLPRLPRRHAQHPRTPRDLDRRTPHHGSPQPQPATSPRLDRPCPADRA